MVSSSLLMKWAGGAAAAACVAFPAQLWVRVNMLEKPLYQVSKTIRVGRVTAELRQYDPYLIAESVVTGDTFKEGTSKGFVNVAGYIFGNNSGGRVKDDGGIETEKVAMTTPVCSEPSQKVAMTSPVRTEMWENLRDMKVSFVMPRKYTAGTLPKPKSKNVRIKSVAAHRMVAVRFRGRSPDEAKLAEVSRDLFKALEGEGLTPKGSLMVYQYHPPFLPGFLRRNEVAVKV